MARTWRLCVVLPAAVLTTACAPLPDVTPFSTATRELASAVRISGDAAAVAIADARSDDEGDAQKQAQAFREAWEARNGAMNALVHYSDSLAAIVQGFNDAKANTAKLSQSLQDLATATGLLTAGAGPGVGVGVGIANLVVEQIAKVKAANSLEEALIAAQPVVDTVAENLGRRLIKNRIGAEPSNDVTDLLAIYNGAASNIETAKLAATQPTIDYLDTLMARRTTLLRGIRDGDPNALSEAAQIATAASAAEAELARLSAPFEERLARVRVARDLAVALAGAVDAWATAHSDLVNAMKQRRPVSVDSLTQAAIEIRALVRRIQEL